MRRVMMWNKKKYKYEKCWKEKQKQKCQLFRRQKQECQLFRRQKRKSSNSGVVTNGALKGQKKMNMLKIKKKTLIAKAYILIVLKAVGTQLLPPKSLFLKRGSGKIPQYLFASIFQKKSELRNSFQLWRQIILLWVRYPPPPLRGVRHQLIELFALAHRDGFTHLGSLPCFFTFSIILLSRMLFICFATDSPRLRPRCRSHAPTACPAFTSKQVEGNFFLFNFVKTFIFSDGMMRWLG